MDDYKERARRRASERQTSSWFKLKEGENSFRILRTPESKKTPGVFYEYALHREVGPRKATVRCGRDPVTGEGACWLCDVQIPKLEQKGLETRAALLASKDSFVVQVAVINERG